MGKKVFKLGELRDVQGRLFRGPERDQDGNVVREPVKDAEGKPIMQVPRNQKGEAIPNCQPEPVYRIKTVEIGKDALCEVLKGLYLNIPQNRLTRQDTIYGTRMFQNIAASKDGVLEIDDDIHDWAKNKLQEKVKNAEGVEQELGILIFGVDLYVVEQAIDNFERKHEKEGAKASET